ncbi:hypothetical protein AAG906_033615 [Vitis piasezkii]
MISGRDDGERPSAPEIAASSHLRNVTDLVIHDGKAWFHNSEGSPSNAVILIDAKVWYTGPASLITKDWSRGAFLLSILIRMCSG